MTASCLTRGIVGGMLLLSLAGCRDAPGKPHMDTASLRPEQVLDFPTLYRQNCAACHGAQGRQGAAISLANPVYLATAGVDNLRHTIANGLPGTLMPAFARTQGGLLTEAQVNVLSQGMMQSWGASAARIVTLPYASQTAANTQQGSIAYTNFCARCHGADGTGNVAAHTGSIIDPAYLDMMNDQALRSVILAGMPDQGMPDWRSDKTTANPGAMSDQEVTDTVAWIALNRTTASHPPLQRVLAPQDQRRTTHE